jgi:hypothetical protein
MQAGELMREKEGGEDKGVLDPLFRPQQPDPGMGENSANEHAGVIVGVTDNDPYRTSPFQAIKKAVLAAMRFFISEALLFCY